MSITKKFQHLPATNTWQRSITKLHEDFEEFSDKGEEHMECYEDEAYVPVNAIKPEVYAMIAAWEAFEISRMKLSGTEGSVDDTNSRVVCEPLHTMTTNQPPKRYYLTFWRSVTQRIIKLKQ